MRIANDKNAVRLRMRSILNGLTLEEKKRQSEWITRMVIKHPQFVSAERISIYLNTANEVATTRLLMESWKNGKTCFIPKYDPASYNMQMVLLRSVEEHNSLPITSWNIRQPPLQQQQEDALDSGGLNLIIVPGLAFTKAGHRLGSGRGYYDRYFQKFLSSSVERPFLLGLAFSQQILPDLPTGDFDVALDEVITCSQQA